MKQINRAWIDNELIELERLFHEEIVFSSPQGEPLAKGREACIDSYAQFMSQAKVLEVTLEDAEVDVFGSTAVAVYGYDMTWEMNGERFQEPGRDLFVFNHDENRWVAVWRTILPGA